MIPEPSTDPGKRAERPDNPSAPRTYKTCCPKCDNSTSGTSDGRRARLCLNDGVLDEHQRSHQLTVIRRALNCESAFSFCGGRFFTPRGELTVPPIRKKPAPASKPRQNLISRVCKYCGNSYKPGSPNSNYCSPECSRGSRSKREKERRAAKRAGDAK